jgi:hypothetical protein
VAEGSRTRVVPVSMITASCDERMLPPLPIVIELRPITQCDASLDTGILN